MRGLAGRQPHYLIQPYWLSNQWGPPQPSVTFVGYRISRQTIGISDWSVKRIKRRFSRILYENLIGPVKNKNLVALRVDGKFDKDYLVAILQMRRYLYGNLTETQLRRFITSASPKIHFKGLMSFYPIVDDADQLKSLDGWLLHTVKTSLRYRCGTYHKLDCLSRRLMGSATRTLSHVSQRPLKVRRLI